MCDQCHDILHEYFHCIRMDAGRLLRLIVTAHVWRDDVVSCRRERANLMSPSIPELRETVEQHHEWSRSRFHIMQSHPIDDCLAVCPAVIRVSHDLRSSHASSASDLIEIDEHRVKHRIRQPLSPRVSGDIVRSREAIRRASTGRVRAAASGVTRVRIVKSMARVSGRRARVCHSERRKQCVPTFAGVSGHVPLSMAARNARRAVEYVRSETPQFVRAIGRPSFRRCMARSALRPIRSANSGTAVMHTEKRPPAHVVEAPSPRKAEVPRHERRTRRGPVHQAEVFLHLPPEPVERRERQCRGIAEREYRFGAEQPVRPAPLVVHGSEREVRPGNTAPCSAAATRWLPIASPQFPAEPDSSIGDPRQGSRPSPPVPHGSAWDLHQSGSPA